jgi:peptidoglycan/LPS O-acetylase OafA/YrhL
MSGIRRALVALAVSGFVLGLAALALVTTSEREPDPAPWVIVALTLGWSFIGAGLYAWWRRPENRVGALMTLVGFLWFLGALTSSDAAWAYTLGLALSSLWIAALVHMLVAFPSGRVGPGPRSLRGRPSPVLAKPGPLGAGKPDLLRSSTISAGQG